MNKYCQTVIFSDKAYNAIIDETFRKNPIETGGILLGHILDNGLWIVMEVIPPGIDSIHQYAYFEYDERFVNYLAESVASKYNDKLELLGLWHRHPGSLDVFSGTDDNTNSIFARLKPCGAISGLVNVDPNFRLTMRHVSIPLQYDVVDVEVGDDLIPENYFKLKYYPENGLNPSLSDEKKNVWKIIENLSEPESETKKEINFIRSKSFSSGLLAIFTIILFSIFLFGQHVVDNNNFKQQVLFEIVYNDSCSMGLHYADSISTISPPKQIDCKKTNDALTKTIPLYIPFKDAISIVNYNLIGICFLLFVSIFLPFDKRYATYHICGSGILALIILQFSPLNFSIASIVFFTFLTSFFFISSIGILKVINLIIHYQKLPWFKKYKKLVSFEEEEIYSAEPDSVQNIDGDNFVFTIMTQRLIKDTKQQLAYQIVYSPQYKKDGIIKLYLILPEFNEIIDTLYSSLSPFIKYDDDGDGFLEFNIKTENFASGGDVIIFLYDCLDSINKSLSKTNSQLK